MKNPFASLGKVLLGVLAGLALSASSAWAQTVTIGNPINNGVYTGPTSFSVIATITGTGIAKVDFYQGITLIGSTSTGPTYAMTWLNVAPGSYTLTAQAKDSAGTVLATSSPVAILVNAAPTINLTSPSNNQLFATGSNIVFNATASDSDGTVSKVDFYRSGSSTPVGTATSAPYTATWNNAPAGSHTFWAQATDNRGGTKNSYTVTIAVAAPPTISLSSPTTNQYYPAPANVTLTASASPGSGGTLSKVEFYQGGTLIGTATAAPYSMSWNNVPAAAESYLFTAKATDNRGLSTTSAIIPITVNAAPSIAITRPSNNQVMSAPANVTLTATAGDADGGIGKVDFYQGTTLIGTATAAPYSIVWSNVPAGTYTLTAQATDNRGIPTSSVPVSVVVNPAGEATGMYFIHPDHLGTPRAITDNTGQTVWRWDNDEPFGDNLANADPQATGTTFQFNLRFPGQYFDQETGNHYNYFRDYDPGTGRYTTSDPIGLAAGQWSTYSYVNGQPTMVVDPEGLAGRTANEVLGYRSCNTDEMRACKAQCGNRGVDRCTARISRVLISVTGDGERGYERNREMLCSCNDDDSNCPTDSGSQFDKFLSRLTGGRTGSSTGGTGIPEIDDAEGRRANPDGGSKGGGLLPFRWLPVIP